MKSNSIIRKTLALTTTILLTTILAQATIRYVKPVSSGSGNGSSWANASSNLNAMLLASASGDEVWVAAGTYKPDRDYTGNTSPADSRNKTFYVKEGVKLYGGFAGTETLISQRNPAINISVLDGDIGTANVNTDNCYHVVLAVNSSATVTGITLDGFTVQSGNAESSGGNQLVNGETIYAKDGGGFILYRGINTITNNLFTNNKGVDGAGVFCFYIGVSTFVKNRYTQNIASSFGGGLYLHTSDVVLLDENDFSSNQGLNTGGGLYAQFCGAITGNAPTFSNNFSLYGGGISLFNCTGLNLTNPQFGGNKAQNDNGGGIVAYSSPVTLSGVTATSNTSGKNGGFLYSHNSTVSISGGKINNNNSSLAGGAIFGSNCDIRNTFFSGNSTRNEGGALYLRGNSVLINDTITGNRQNSAISGTDGGGGICFNFGDVILRNSVISNNNSYKGGGISLFGGTPVEFTGNFITGNTTVTDGGGIHALCNNFIGGNNIIAQNTAGGNGGGLFYQGQNGDINSCTIVSNAAGGNGGGIYINSTNSFKITNSALWDNKKSGSATISGADIFNNAGVFNSLLVRKSLLQLSSGNYTTAGNGNYDIGTAAIGNLFNTDPQFVSISSVLGPDGIGRTADDGLYPQYSSPLFNGGDSNLLPPGLTTDITGAARVYGNNTDIGAYEYYTCVTGLSRRYVNAAASTGPIGPAAGTTWDLAYTSMADALEAARTCNSINEIWVAKGTYKPTMAYPGNSNPADNRDKTFYMPLNVKIYGGFAGAETNLTQRNTVTNETILSGDIGTVNNNSDNCYHVLVASSSNAVIDGFTIRDGNANGSSGVSIAGNTIFRVSGGGIVLAGGNNKVKNNIITDNNALNGGGIATTAATDSITNNFFTNNSITLTGGGINSSLSTEFIANNIFWNNTASVGGGFYSNRSVIHFNSNTFFANTATGNAGALFTFDGSGRFSNTIFWNNAKAGSTSAPGADYYNNSSTADNNLFKHNLLQLNATDYSMAGIGNYDLGTTASGNLFSIDPLFKLPANAPGPDGKLRTADDGLMPDVCSPVINTGNNSLLPAIITTDIINNSRIQLSTVDMGAYEAASIAPAGIATSNLSLTTFQSTTTLYTNSCSNLITKVVASGASPISGSTTARVWIEPTPPSSFVKRHYEITPAANAATATGRVTLYFTQQDFTDFNTTNAIKLPVNAADAANHKANLRIEKRSGTSNNGTGLPGSYTGSITVIDPADADIVWNSASGRWEVSFDVTGFSGFFVKTTSGILPVNWISFNGTLNANKQAALNWNVEEHNVIRYDAEKSITGNNFIPVGSLPGQGDGNHTYSFTDPAPLSERAYYRIKQVDADGRYSYSAVIMLNTNSKASLSVYPNPAKQNVQITSSKKQTAAVYDASGKTIRVLPLLPGTVSVNTEGWSKGLYILKTETGETIKLVKE